MFIATVSPHNSKLHRSVMFYMSPLTGLEMREQTVAINITSLTGLFRHAALEHNNIKSCVQRAVLKRFGRYPMPVDPIP
jgi:hypothetical protein